MRRDGRRGRHRATARSARTSSSSQAELHAAYGGVVPEIASRRHLELISPVIREALDEAGASLDEIDTVAVTAGPGLIGALLVGVAAAKALAWARGLPLVPVNHLHGHVASLYLQPLDLEPPFTCLLASGGHTLLLDVRDRAWEEVARARARRSTTPPARRSTRARGCSGCRTRAAPRSTGSPATGDPDGLRLPGRARARASTSRSRGSRRRCSTPCATSRRPSSRRAGPISPRATSARSSARSSSGSRRPARDRLAIVGGVAANSELRAALPDAVAAPLALCTDNAAMIASAARYSAPVPAAEYLALDAFASTS